MMVGSQLLSTWAAFGVPPFLLVSVGFLVWRRHRKKRLDEARSLEERRVMAQRIADVRDEPPLPLPPSLHSTPAELWTRHRPNRFRRQEERPKRPRNQERRPTR
jgi:hypothetical protein